MIDEISKRDHALPANGQTGVCLGALDRGGLRFARIFWHTLDLLATRRAGRDLELGFMGSQTQAS
jgi:hypothetical protein